MDVVAFQKNAPDSAGESHLKPILRGARFVLEGAICGVAAIGVFTDYLGVAKRDAVDLIGALFGAIAVLIALTFRNSDQRSKGVGNDVAISQTIAAFVARTLTN